MNFYLSSYKVGEAVEELRRLTGGRTLGLIPNALDHHLEESARSERVTVALREIQDLGIDVVEFDLRTYFGSAKQL